MAMLKRDELTSVPAATSTVGPMIWKPWSGGGNPPSLVMVDPSGGPFPEEEPQPYSAVMSTRARLMRMWTLPVRTAPAE